MAFQEALERRIYELLLGEDRSQPLPGGLYQALRGSLRWEDFQRAAGRIEALEGVLRDINDIATRMHDDTHVRSEYDRRMN